MRSEKKPVREPVAHSSAIFQEISNFTYIDFVFGGMDLIFSKNLRCSALQQIQILSQIDDFANKIPYFALTITKNTIQLF